MADAYAFAEQGQYSKEIDLLRQIDRFGVEGVLGRRTLYYGELRCLLIAEAIVKAYSSRARSESWAEWVESNPQKAQLLNEAEKLCRS